MPAPLDPALRRLLENTVIKARDRAEVAASAAITRLTITEKDARQSLSPQEKALRSALRAKARQLGDAWNATKQAFDSISRLEHEIAYEHWHRMLFARFLAENNLLIHPEFEVPITLQECEALAKEAASKAPAGVTSPDKWMMAGNFAAAMLPQIFRPDEPALRVDLAPEHQQELEGLLESLPAAVFTADDSLGWVYQFWQSAEKERVNAGVKGGDKITGATLPAVTQLFTEHYMVLFLLHNTIGAWHAAKQMAKLPKERMARWATEADVRAAVALPGYAFDYLRFVKDDAAGDKEGGEAGEWGGWRPAAGTFPLWPKTAKELTVLDPCCGSGHFLVAALELLTRLRMAEDGGEGVAAADAVKAVLEDNLFGLELDPRCTQIAAFNVALAAWKVAGKHFTPPEIHIACSGLAPNCTQEQWLKLAETRMSPMRRSASPTHPLLPTHGREAVKNTLRDMHELFSKAPDLGSLIDPAATAGTLGSADWETVKPFLTDVLAEESQHSKAGGGDADALERAVAAQGMAKAAEVLSGEYILVITNVPYLGRGGQGDVIKAFCEKVYAEAKADLATVFVSRILRWLGDAGTTAVVTPQNWLFLTSYKKFRERLLNERMWNLVVRMGEHAFESSAAAGAFAAMMVLSGGKPAKDAIMAGIDVSAPRGQRPIYAAEKAALLRGEGAEAAARHPDGQPRQVSGQERQVTCQPRQADGQERQETGQERPIDGQPRQADGQLRQETGQPRQVTGRVAASLPAAPARDAAGPGPTTLAPPPRDG